MFASIRFPSVFCCWAVLLAAPLSAVEPDDWPQFRGVQRDGVAYSRNLRASWPEAGLQPVWKRSLGDGFSGIAVTGGKLYTMFAEEGREFVACFKASDGSALWRTPVGETFLEEFGDGPRSTPTLDGDRLFVLGARGNLMALDKATGTSQWQVSLTKRFGAEVARWGYSTSPLVEGDMLLVEAGGGDGKSIVALNKHNGKTLWQSANGVVGYSSPIAVTFNGLRQFIFLCAQGLTSYELVSLSTKGSILWKRPVPGFIVAMPLLIPPDKIFVSASNDDGCTLFQLVADGEGVNVREVWSNRVMRNHFNSSVFFRGHLYGFNNATFRCVDVATGEHKWSKRGYGKGSVILAGDRLIALSDRGKLVLAEATPDAYRQISVFQALEGKSWTSPTLAGGRLYLRNQKDMVCYDLRQP